ncbi:MAG: hypothetical protein J0M15_11120 [Deltaproteobacteria bacterium]|nr:hypothetical protein [Deltaproteobacteria bacterium]
MKYLFSAFPALLVFCLFYRESEATPTISLPLLKKSLNNENAQHSIGLFIELQKCYDSLKKTDPKNAAFLERAVEEITETVYMEQSGQKVTHFDLLNRKQNFVETVPVNVFSEMAMKLESIHNQFQQICKKPAPFNIGHSRTTDAMMFYQKLVSDDLWSTQFLMITKLLNNSNSPQPPIIRISLEKLLKYFFSESNQKTIESYLNIGLALIEKPIVRWSLIQFFSLPKEDRLKLLNDTFQDINPYQFLYPSSADENEIYPFVNLNIKNLSHKSFSCLAGQPFNFNPTDKPLSQIFSFLFNQLSSRCPEFNFTEKILLLNQHDRFKDWTLPYSLRTQINAALLNAEVLKPKLIDSEKANTVLMKFLPWIEFNTYLVKRLRETDFHHYSTAALTSCLRLQNKIKKESALSITILAGLGYQMLDIQSKLNANIGTKEIIKNASLDLDLWDQGARFCW